MRFRMSLVVLGSVLSLASLGRAQQVLGTISGTVTDATGAVLPGVKIELLNEETGISRTAATNNVGRYTAPALGLGKYKVTASLEGFQTQVRSGIELTVGREAVVNMQLQVGAVTQTVEVTGEAPLVETTKGGLGTLVESKTVTDLPLNGRDIAQLITLQTGAVEYTAGGSDLGAGKLLVVSGARPTMNVFMIDGVAIESYTSKTPTGTSGQFLGAEAVREFRVETNAYSAEFGRGAGGIFNVATKNGTNTMHGSLFEYLRNDILDAAKWEDNRSGSEKPAFKRNQFGGSIGGPIVKDHTFYFATYEGLRERLGNIETSRTFSDELRRGILTPGGTPVPIVPAVQQYLDSSLWPRPNGPLDPTTNTAEFNFSTSQPTTEDLLQVRLDHKISDSDSIFGRYTYLNSRQTTTGSWPYDHERLIVHNNSVALEENHIFTPTLLNTARIGFSRNLPIDDAFQDPDPPFPTSLRFVPIVELQGALNPGSPITGAGNGVPGEFRASNSFQYVDDMTWTKGRNTMKWGFSINHIQFNGWNPGRDAADYSFNNFTDFFAGIPTGRFRGTIAVCCNDAFRSIKNTIIGLYYQDDLHLTPRLTVNAGLRYEFITIPSEKYGRIANFKGDLAFIQSPTTSVNGLTKGNPWIENPSLKNFAPRVGFAWDVTGNGKMAVRGGFGLFFQQLDTSWYRTSAFRTPPILVELEQAACASNCTGQARANRLPFPNASQICGTQDPFAPTDPRCSARAAPDVLDFKVKTPYVIQYNLNVQRQIAGSTVLTVGYAGSRGVKLAATSNINAWAPQEIGGRLAWPSTLTSQPNPNFDIIRFRHTGYNSWYNSLQVNATRKYSQGLAATGSYTWSSNIDQISGIQTASDTSSGSNVLPDYFVKNIYKGRSSFDAKHVFTFNSTWELPFGNGMQGVGKYVISGWQLGGIVQAGTGFPETVSIGARFQSVGHGDEYADLAPGFRNNPIDGKSAGCTILNGGTIVSADPPAGTNLNNSRRIAPGTPLGTPALWFDPCAFPFPPTAAVMTALGFPGTQGALGNLGRNTVTMPGRWTVDFSLLKSFPVTETAKLQFRFEAFNIFNNANFGIPSRQVFNSSGRPSGTAGQITSTVGTARQLQFALRFTF